MLNWLKTAFTPAEHIPEEARIKGMKNATRQVIMAAAADGLTSGGLLVAFAIIIGASNLHIGIITAVPFIMQPIQLVAVTMVEKSRKRKIIAIPAYFIAYAIWVPVAAIPFFIDTPHSAAVALLIAFITIRGAANAFINTSWTSWLRDMVPHHVMGDFFANRLRAATIAIAVSSILAAIFIDWWKGYAGPEDAVYGYSISMFIAAIVFGLAAVAFMTRISEIRMPQNPNPNDSILDIIREPLRDKRYRPIINFLFIWNFVIYLAIPFFAIYMLVRLELPLSIVVAMGILSHIGSIVFVRVWGQFTDRFGGKAVLSICCSLLLLVIITWTLTTLPERHSFTIPMLIALHILIGIANAGINISTTAIRLKMAPEINNTSYITLSSIAGNIAAGISPFIGGAFADFFAERRFEVTVTWIDPYTSFDFPAIVMSGYDFLFAIAFVLGLATLPYLAKIREEGETDSSVVMDELRSQARENMRVLNSMPGFTQIARIPTPRIRYIPPVPGLDVAIGVTAYQIASSIKTTIDTTISAANATRKMQSRINRIVSAALRQTRGTSQHAYRISADATKTAIQSISDATKDSQRFFTAAIRATLRANAHIDAEPFDALSATAQGAIQGAEEAGIEPYEIIQPIFDAAAQTAQEFGISEEQAVSYTALAALETSQRLDQPEKDKMQEQILEQINTRTNQPTG